MTVERLLREISSRELSEWMVYEQLAGPLGDRRGDYQAAQITAALINVHRGRAQKARSPDDVVLRWDDREPMTPEEIYNQIRQINAELGGTVATDRDTAAA
ncbi:DUF4035 domain-containing protein [Sphaerisporangium sp. NPDC049003]|uniref:phage tail assembly protein T n=1 Tax=Sphaerisporangium sp. NPDC049003 TaxID=3364517 RepID=UPI00371A202A